MTKVADVQLLCLSCIPVIVGAITIWTAPWHPTIGPLMGYYLVAVRSQGDSRKRRC
jgi:hypothetical protein